MNINKISLDKHKFLQMTSVIDKPPKTLYYAGILPETRTPTVAIVGTRKPTGYGKEVTYTIAHDLAKQGVVVVSGLALGVDRRAAGRARPACGATRTGGRATRSASAGRGEDPAVARVRPNPGGTRRVRRMRSPVGPANQGERT